MLIKKKKIDVGVPVTTSSHQWKYFSVNGNIILVPVVFYNHNIPTEIL